MTTLSVAPLNSPGLVVAGNGSIACAPSGSYDWIVHRGRAPVAFLTTPLMGLGAGEELAVEVSIGGGASATLTSQGPTSLLRCEKAALQSWTIEIGEAGHLTLLPWVTIPFSGSRSRSRVDVRLGSSASLVAWETLAVGRVAMGEHLEFEQLESAWKIQGPKRLLLHERFALRRGDSTAAGEALGGRTHLGSLYVAGPPARELDIESLQGLLDARLDLVGVSRPATDLLLVRALDHGSERLERAFWPIVNQAREAAGLHAHDPAEVARRWFGP